MVETMTVHKALVELKTLDKRINDEVNGIEFVKLNKHSSTKVDGVDVTDYINSVKAKYKSVMTLINRRNAIKQAVTKSNATAKVEINGKEYTVAEAIDMKSFGMGYISTIVNRIKSQYGLAQRKADMCNGDSLERRADEFIKCTYQNVDKKSMTSEMLQQYDNFVKSQTTEIVDPLDAEKTIAFLNDEVDKFMTEVDSALSVSNALTTVTVEYNTL